MNRVPGMSGPSPITDQQILAWSELNGIIIWPEEVDCIVYMDSAWRGAVQKMTKRNADYSQAVAASKQKKGRR